MTKKNKMITTLLTSSTLLVVPTLIVVTNRPVVNNYNYESEEKSNKLDYYLDPHRTQPSKLDKFEVMYWIKQHGSLKIRPIRETFDRIVFAAELDTNGAFFRYGGAFVVSHIYDAKTRTYKEEQTVAYYEEGYNYGFGNFYKGQASGYREFIVKKRANDEKYKFTLDVGYGSTADKSKVWAKRTTWADGWFIVPSFKDPNIKFNIRRLENFVEGFIILEHMSEEYTLEWQVDVKNGDDPWTAAVSKKFNKVSDFRDWKIRFDAKRDKKVNQEFRAWVLVRDKDGNILKFLKSETITVYSEKDDSSNNGENNSANKDDKIPGYVNGNRVPKPPFQIC